MDNSLWRKVFQVSIGPFIVTVIRVLTDIMK